MKKDTSHNFLKVLKVNKGQIMFDFVSFRLIKCNAAVQGQGLYKEEVGEGTLNYPFLWASPPTQPPLENPVHAPELLDVRHRK